MGRWRRAFRRPRVAVIVTVGPGQEGRLNATLSGLAGAQQVLLAPWGDHADSFDAPRVTVLAPAANANAARNAAWPMTQRGASADLLVFLEAGDLLDPSALSGLTWLPPGQTCQRHGPAHRLASYVWTPDGVPEFDPSHGRFAEAALPVDSGPPDQRAGASWLREQATPWPVPFGTTPDVVAELPAFVRALGACREAPWLGAFLAEVGPVFLDDLERATDLAGLDEVVADLPLAGLAELTAYDRLRWWLVGAGRRDEMSRLTAEQWYAEGQLPTRVAGGRILLDVGTQDVPDEIVEVRPQVQAHLHRVRRSEAGVTLTVWPALAGVDFARYPPSVSAVMVHESGRWIPLGVSATPDPAASRHFRRDHESQAEGAVEVRLDPTALDYPGVWRLDVRVRAAGVECAGPITSREERGSAGTLARLDLGGMLSFEPGTGVTYRPGEAPEPRPNPQDVVAHEVVTNASLVVSGTSRHALDGVELRSGARRVAGRVNVAGPGAFEVVFDWREDPWSLGERALPVGTWHLVWRAGAQEGEVGLTDGLAAATPEERLTGTHRIELLRGLREQLLLRLRPPLADDELGPLAQRQLRADYALSPRPADPALVLFNSYAGAGETDSPRAVLAELRRRGAGHRCLWVVADHSVLAPVGSEPVLRQSRAWHEALATAGTIVTNVEMERWFRRGPEQWVVQTFHGYPSKSMGLDLWRAKNMSPSRLTRMLEQTSAQWSLLVTPDPSMDRYYREQYVYEGPILNRGYPRDDELVNAGAELRQAARHRLGLADGQTVVLYAPTWRDDQATNFRAAPLVSHLDVQAAAAELGAGYALLLRGHRFHQPPGAGGAGAGGPGADGAGADGSGRGTAQIIDVTGYPEINHLIAAADVAVLDYSSLRFDFALTGRPMIFLVPDLESYAGTSRGFLYPFTESAPGPLLDSSGAVVDALRDPVGLAAAYADELSAFNARFNAQQDGHAAARLVDWIVG